MHGTRLDYRKTFLVINFLHLVHQEIILKESLRCDTRCYRTRNTKRDRISPTSNRTGTSFARDDEQNKGTIPMQMFARRPSTMSSSMPVEILQNSMVGQQRQQISELQFDKFPTPASFLCWKIRFKNQVTTCSDIILDR